MGLAASQAKLLFITQRQNDVSAKMQRISNDTMILARDDEEVSAKYSKMLYATKKVLKGDDAFIYDNLMGATAAQNDYYQGILNAAKKVVLDSSLRSALPGLKTDVGTGTEFVKAYPTAKDFQKAIAPANNKLSMELNSKMIGFVNEYGEYPTAGKTTMGSILKSISSSWGTYINDACGARNAQDGYGKNFSNNVKDLSFWDIANGKNGEDYVVILAHDNGKVSGVPYDAAKSNFKNIGNAISNAICTSMGRADLVQQMKNYVSGLADGINFCDNSKERDTDRAYQNGVDDARNCLVGNCTETYRKGSDNDVFTLNISEYVRKLTEKALSLASGGAGAPGSNVRDSSNTSKEHLKKSYDVETYEAKLREKFPDDDEYNKVLATLKNTAPDVEVSNYYQQMYDNLAEHGWSFEDIADIKAKLNDLTSGYSLSSDNASKANDDLYAEVPDEETRNKATAWYEAEMSKINRKEKILQTELTKLQNEYSELTNDMNSVQSIIQGNVQRSFTFCQSG